MRQKSMTSRPKLVISRSLIPYMGMYNGVWCVTEWAANDMQGIRSSHLHEVYSFEKFVLDASMHRCVLYPTQPDPEYGVTRVLNSIINTHDYLMNIKLLGPTHTDALAYIIDCVNDELDLLAKRHSREHFTTPGVVKMFSEDKLIIGAIPDRGVW